MSVSANWRALVQKQSVTEAADSRAVKPGGKKRPRTDRTPKAASEKLPPVLDAEQSKQSVLVSNDKVSSNDVVAMDCEMVGVGHTGAESVLARCSIVNFAGDVLYDKYVKAKEPVTDYRTHVSGILPEHLSSAKAVDFAVCQREVAAILKGRILVGHSVTNDLDVLMLTHPRHMVRDTARNKALCPHRPRALKVLVQEKLQITVQDGQHDSVEDARCVMALYRMYRKTWEIMMKKKGTKSTGKVAGKAAVKPEALVPPGNEGASTTSDSGKKRQILHAKRKQPVTAITAPRPPPVSVSFAGVRPGKNTKGGVVEKTSAADKPREKQKAKLLQAKKRAKIA